MAEISPPGFLQSGANGARQGRLLATGQISAGVWASTNLAVTAGSGLTVNVALGGVYVDLGTGQGKAACYNDASVAKTHAAGGASARVDLIVARVRGSEFGDGADTWVIEVVDGTSVAPAVPATPARSYVLARVAIGASAAVVGTITDMRAVAAYTGSLSGGTVAATTLTASGAATVTGLTTLNGGLVVPYNTNNTVVTALTGSVNKQVMTARFNPNLVSGVATGTINFGATFANPPQVVFGMAVTPVTTSPVIVNWTALTSTSFTYRAVQLSGAGYNGTVTATYIAVG